MEPKPSKTIIFVPDSKNKGFSLKNFMERGWELEKVGYDPQLASGSMVFFDPVQPQLGKFSMMNSLGPWVLERPTQDILYLLLVFDSYTLIDNLRESRAVLTGLNS